MLDLSLLRIAKHREDFMRLRGRIPDSALDAQTKALLDDYAKYFQKFPEHKNIDMNVFLSMFRAWHPGLKDDKRSAFEAVLTSASKDLDADAREKIMRALMELRLATDMAKLAEDFSEGDLPNLWAELQRVTNEFKRDTQIKDEEDFIKTDIESILDVEADDDNGWKWRLECLNTSMRNLRRGDFGIIAGRPDQGKTTFVASELTYMGQQLTGDEHVLWLNNEGVGEKIIARIWQSALGATRSQLMELKKRGIIRGAYERVMGDMHRVRIKDVHGWDCFKVEGLIERTRPSIVVFDMIDNIRGFGDAARTDLGLERMYAWARELAVQHGFAGVATSQISNEGDNMQFPTMNMLKDSKTGKQGACDFQIMIGSKYDPGYSKVRWIGVPKNKLRRETGPADPRATVKYEPMRGRYEDLPMVAEEEIDAA